MKLLLALLSLSFTATGAFASPRGSLDQMDTRAYEGRLNDGRTKCSVVVEKLANDIAITLADEIRGESFPVSITENLSRNERVRESGSATLREVIYTRLMPAYTNPMSGTRMAAQTQQITFRLDDNTLDSLAIVTRTEGQAAAAAWKCQNLVSVNR